MIPLGISMLHTGPHKAKVVPVEGKELLSQICFSSSWFLLLCEHALTACLTLSQLQQPREACWAASSNCLFLAQAFSDDGTGTTDTLARGSLYNIACSSVPFLFENMTYWPTRLWTKKKKIISEFSWLLLRFSISRDKIDYHSFKVQPQEVNANRSPTTWFLNGHSQRAEITAFPLSCCASWKCSAKCPSRTSQSGVIQFLLLLVLSTLPLTYLGFNDLTAGDSYIA